MKRGWTFLAVALLLFGCAKIKEVKENMALCYNDPACFNQAIQEAHDRGEQAGKLAGLTGLPWAERVAQPAVGYVSLLFALAVLGKKLKEKDKPV